MTDETSDSQALFRQGERDIDVEYHDGEEVPVCVGQWCCGCLAHPIGKPWGWNYMAWERHNDEHH